MVPIKLPLKTRLAYGIGLPVAFSVTFPEISVVCAEIFTIKKNEKINISSFLITFSVIFYCFSARKCKYNLSLWFFVLNGFQQRGESINIDPLFYRFENDSSITCEVMSAVIRYFTNYMNGFSR